MAVPLFHAVGLAAKIRAAAEKAAPADFIGKLIAQVPFAIAPQTEELSLAFLEVAPSRRRLCPNPSSKKRRSLSRSRWPRYAKISIQPAPIVFRGGDSQPQPFGKRRLVRADRQLPRAGRRGSHTARPLRLSHEWSRWRLPTNCGHWRRMPAQVGIRKLADLQGYVQPMELTTATGAPCMESGAGQLPGPKCRWLRATETRSRIAPAAAPAEDECRQRRIGPGLGSANRNVQPVAAGRVAIVRVKASSRPRLPLRCAKPARPRSAVRCGTCWSRL